MIFNRSRDFFSFRRKESSEECTKGRFLYQFFSLQILDHFIFFEFCTRVKVPKRSVVDFFSDSSDI